MSIIDRIRAQIKDPLRINSFPEHDDSQCFPPTTLECIEKAEEKMGLHLPDLLCDLYTQVGNGGFGPGYGLIGVAGTPHARCHSELESYDLSHMYLAMGPGWGGPGWPNGLVPICDWGCRHMSLMDCSQPSTPIVFFIGAGNDARLQSPSFRSWMEDWLAGVDLWGKGLHGSPWESTPVLYVDEFTLDRSNQSALEAIEQYLSGEISAHQLEHIATRLWIETSRYRGGVVGPLYKLVHGWDQRYPEIWLKEIATDILDDGE